MDRNYNDCLDFVFEREAGYVNDPNDPGGPTNLGITLAVLGAWRHRKVGVSDIKSLSLKEAAAIYRKNYWHAAHCEQMPDGVDLLLFDAAVNMGVVPALNLLRAQVGLAVPPRHRRHGRAAVKLQPMTKGHMEAALRALCVPGVIQGLTARRQHFYRSLKGFSHFGKGWLARVDLAQRLAMRLWVVGGTGIPVAAGQTLNHRRRHRAATH